MKPGQYKDILRATIEKFGPLASELTTVGLSCGDRSLRGPGVLGIFWLLLGPGALETHMTVMLRLVPEEALVEMKIPGKDHRERAGNLLDQNFQRDIPREELSDATRLFVRAHGVDIPDIVKGRACSAGGVARSRQEDCPRHETKLWRPCLMNFFREAAATSRKIPSCSTPLLTRRPAPWTSRASNRTRFAPEACISQHGTPVTSG